MDPFSLTMAAITAAGTATSDVCKVLLSAEGQLVMKQWREDGTEFRRVIGAIGTWFEQTFEARNAAKVK